MIKVFVNATVNKMLIDLRPMSSGIQFGLIHEVAEQYGIICEEIDEKLYCRGPKSRMQFFVEKLHFSGVPYYEVE